MRNNELGTKFFRTSSFYPAAFLFAKGVELVNIEHGNQQRAEFIFIDSPERAAILHSFNFATEDDPEVMLDARKYVTAIKTLKDRLYQKV